MAHLRLSVRESSVLLRRLALYLRSGMPLMRALSLMEDGVREKQLCTALGGAIQEGSTLADALEQHPRAFPSLVGPLVRAGEASGTLAPTLAELALLLEARRALHAKLVSALIYPCLIVVATVGIALFLVLYAFPKIVPVFRGFRAALPLSTRILIALADGAERYGVFLLVLLVAMVAAGIYALRTPSIAAWVDRTLLRLPVLGGLVQAYHLAHLMRTLSGLLRSGMRLVPALTLTHQAVESPTYRTLIQNAEERVMHGVPLSEALRSPIMPVFVRQMLTSGEATGSLAESIALVSETYATELDERARTLTTLIEPVLMIGVGLVVGFIALAIITPLYRITEDLTLH
jgi:type II secretory pathway component PulF